MVFQNYALFPHMTRRGEHRLSAVGARRARGRDRAARVERALDMVQLGGFGGRRPAQLSGGQQQRVAVARALVFEPKLMLMDEPLGALDKQLREQMQLEIRRLHQRLGVTMVYVTHDQAEALTMSDRIAVFHRGRIQQLDTPGADVRIPEERLRRPLHRREQPSRRQPRGDRRTAAARSASRPAMPGSKARWSSRCKTAARSPFRCGRSGCKSHAAGHTIDGSRGCQPGGHAARDHLPRRPRPCARGADRATRSSW